MSFLSIGRKVINLDRICYVDDFTGDDGEPILAVVMAGLNKKNQPLFLEGEERAHLLAWLLCAEACDEDDDTDEYVCEDCQRQEGMDCN